MARHILQRVGKNWHEGTPLGRVQQTVEVDSVVCSGLVFEFDMYRFRQNRFRNKLRCGIEAHEGVERHQHCEAIWVADGDRAS